MLFAPDVWYNFFSLMIILHAIFTNKLNPKTVVPIHYGLVVGTKEDLNTFKENLKEDIKIEEKLFML